MREYFVIQEWIDPDRYNDPNHQTGEPPYWVDFEADKEYDSEVAAIARLRVFAENTRGYAGNDHIVFRLDRRFTAGAKR